jgi:hypothetical protein
MRFATVLTGHTWLADDLVSSVLGRAFERWDRIDGAGMCASYSSQRPIFGLDRRTTLWP